MAGFDRQVFISHSAHDDPWATGVRAALVAGLRGRAGYRPLIDEEDFAAGDLWRPTLYRWLAQADAAVLLLTEASLRSQWVRTEATVLLWRRGLRSAVRVVPVLLGVDITDVRAAWPTLEVDEAHAVSAAAGEDPAGVVDRVLAQFVELGDADDRMRGWVALVAGLLGRAAEPFLRSGAERLGLPAGDPGLDLLTIGYALLHADIGRLERSLNATVGGLDSPRPLLELVVPGCLPAEFAEPLLRAMNRPEGRRVAVVGATRLAIGPRMAQRATCCDPDLATVPAMVRGSEHPVDQLLADLLDQLAEAVGLPGEEPLPVDVAGMPGPVVVVVQNHPRDGARLPAASAVAAGFSATIRTAGAPAGDSR